MDALQLLHAAAAGGPPSQQPIPDGVLGFVSRKDGKTCRVCGKDMPMGTIIIPDPLCPMVASSSYTAPEAAAEKPQRSWIHRTCAPAALPPSALPAATTTTAAGSDTTTSSSGDAAGSSPAAAINDRPICKHWRRRGKCSFGDRCYFLHPAELAAGAPGRPPATDGAAGESKTKKKRAWGGRRRRLKNDNRCAVFRRFLLDVYGREHLSSGSGVLDVAGGKGELAFELVNCNQVPATVIEPRPLRLDNYSKKYRRGMYHRNLATLIGGTQSARPGGASAELVAANRPTDPQAPGHCRLMLTEPLLAWLGLPEKKEKKEEEEEEEEEKEEVKGGDDLVEADQSANVSGAAGGPADPDPEEFIQEQLARARRLMWTPKGLHDEHDEGCRLRLDREEEDDDEEVDEDREARQAAAPAAAGAAGAAAPADAASTDNGASPPPRPGVPVAEEVVAPTSVRQLFLDSSVVVGMHPDQATEPIVNLALRTGRPFACVPCCVYSKEFPKRRLAGGGAVTTYDDFIQYLVEKTGGRAEVQELEFEGRNKVVFVRPEMAVAAARAAPDSTGDSSKDKDEAA